MASDVQVITKKEQPLQTFMNMLEKSKDSIAAALPKHMTAERVSRLALTCFRTNKDLQKCDLRSIIASVMVASQLGLEVGVLGQAYLVPYRNNKAKPGEATHECQRIPGYQGLTDLRYRTGRVESVFAEPVYANDKFTLKLGIQRTIEHEPSLEGDRGPLRLCYAVAVLKDGGYVMEWMTVSEIEAIRKRSRAKDNGPWVTDYIQMCLKTVIRRLAKRAPKSIELHNAVQLDYMADKGQRQGLTIDTARLMTTDPLPELPELPDDDDQQEQDEKPAPKDPPKTEQKAEPKVEPTPVEKAVEAAAAAQAPSQVAPPVTETVAQAPVEQKPPRTLD